MATLRKPSRYSRWKAASISRIRVFAGMATLHFWERFQRVYHKSTCRCTTSQLTRTAEKHHSCPLAIQFRAGSTLEMKRIAFFTYGVACHLLFLAVYLYFVGFVGNWLISRSIDTGPSGPVASDLAIDLALLLIFGLQHSVMARPAFKEVWTKLVPQPIERSTYVLVSCLALMLLMWQWRPIGLVIWNVQHPAGWGLLTGMFVAGSLGVPIVSLMINHFDLFGTRQVWLHLQGRPYTSLPFATPLAYSVVRHPL